MPDAAESIPVELRDPLVETLTVQAQHLVTENRALREQLGFVKYELEQARSEIAWYKAEVKKLREAVFEQARH